jgi:DNA-binding MarR family transcriptional regulator
MLVAAAVKGADSVMTKASRTAPAHDGSVMLNLLEAVERQDNVTQRSLANELGVAVGLINAYVKRGMKRGFIKVQQVPKRRFVYYLTSQGFAEKSRLAALYLSSSFEFFRKARHDCESVAREASDHGWNRIVLVGASDLAEIAIICAPEATARIVGVVDVGLSQKCFHGLPVWTRLEDARAEADAAMVTSLENGRRSFVNAAAVFGDDRVLVPGLLRVAVAAPVNAKKERAS